MKYQNELDFMKTHMKNALDTFVTNEIENKIKKSEYDIVTEIDSNIENYLISQIRKNYPEDKILSEETLSTEKINNRTWIIDPIDGTCNMANGMELYGIQCALVEDNEIVVSVIILASNKDVYYAISGEGAYLNDVKITVDKNVPLNSALVSFGDYSHVNKFGANRQHKAIGTLFSKVAKIRMFGAACMDFSFVASSKTNATVVITKNLWDVLPGVLLCKESGCVITDLDGNEYTFASDGVIVSCNEELHGLVVTSMEK